MAKLQTVETPNNYPTLEHNVYDTLSDILGSVGYTETLRLCRRNLEIHLEDFSAKKKSV